MTIEIQFTTESSPGEQPFERAVYQVTAFLAEHFKGTDRSYGVRTNAVLRMGVRASLADDGTTSVVDVRDTLTDLQEVQEVDDAEIEMLCRRLDPMKPSSHRRDTESGIDD